MKQKLRFKSYILAIIISMHALNITGAIIPLGQGGYTNQLPTGQHGPSDQNNNPVTPKTTATFNQLPTTNDWSSSFIWQSNPTNPYSFNAYPHPLSVRGQSTGIGLGYPNTIAITPDILLAKGEKVQEYHYNHQADLVVGVVGLTSPDDRVSRYSDWTISVVWNGNGRTLEMTVGHGLPFAYFTKSGDNASITVNGTPTIWSNSNGVIGLSVGGRHYGIFGPQGSVWTGTTVLQSSLNGKNYFSIASLPDNTPTTLEFFRKYAYAFVTNTTVSWNYNQATSQVITTFNVATTLQESGNGNLNQPLLALYRHQWLNTTASLTNYTYVSPCGIMKVFDGSSFTTALTFNGVVPELPLVAIDGQNTFNRTQLYNYVDTIFKQAPLDRWQGITVADTYWYGKAMGRISRLIHVADKVGHTAARDLFLSELKTRISSWFTGQGSQLFYYDNTWKTLIGYPASYGSDTQLNDHHFHYGYFLMGAATIAQYDPTWASQSAWGAMTELLVKDVANWNRNDTQFPFLRFFDPYAGHCWANGSSLFDAGNNQESSSESMNFSSALILWGSATGNTTLRDLGIYLYTTEVSAIEQYWFDINDIVFPAGFTKPTLGMIWGNGGAYAIWWDGYVEEIHGINFLPITGGSLYLGRNPNYLQINQAFMPTNGGGSGTWRDIHMAVTALYDPSSAISTFNANEGYTPEAGESKAHTYAWIHNLNILGQLNKTVTANTPTYAVFTKGTVNTYVAHNFSNTPISVLFSDGAVLNVPAHTTAVGNGTDTNNGGGGGGGTPPSVTPLLDFTIDFIETQSGMLNLLFTPSWTSSAVDLYYSLTYSNQSVLHMAFTAPSWKAQIANLHMGDIVSCFFSYEKNGQSLTTNLFDVIYGGACSPCSTSTTGTGTGGGSGSGGGGSTNGETVDNGTYIRSISILAGNKALISFTPKIPSTFVDIHYIINTAGQLNYRMTNTNGTWNFTIPTLNVGDTIHYSFTYDQNGPAYDTPQFSFTRTV